MAVRSVETAVDEILAEYATTFCLRPVRRQEAGPRIVWSVDEETMVEFVHTETGPDLVLVHEIGLVRQLKKQLRSGRVKVEYVLKN